MTLSSRIQLTGATAAMEETRALDLETDGSGAEKAEVSSSPPTSPEPESASLFTYSRTATPPRAGFPRIEDFDWSRVADDGSSPTSWVKPTLDDFVYQGTHFPREPPVITTTSSSLDRTIHFISTLLDSETNDLALFFMMEHRVRATRTRSRAITANRRRKSYASSNRRVSLTRRRAEHFFARSRLRVKTRAAPWRGTCWPSARNRAGAFGIASRAATSTRSARSANVLFHRWKRLWVLAPTVFSLGEGISARFVDGGSGVSTGTCSRTRRLKNSLAGGDGFRRNGRSGCWMPSWRLETRREQDTAPGRNVGGRGVDGGGLTTWRPGDVGDPGEKELYVSTGKRQSHCK